MKMMYFDREGVPISDKRMWKLGKDYKIIKQEQVKEVWISTVWLGIDHQFGDGPPLIFETMVFDEARDELDCRRYSTEAEAINGHREMVEKWSS